MGSARQCADVSNIPRARDARKLNGRLGVHQMRRLFLVGVIIAAILGVSGVVGPTHALADTKNVDSWIDLSTVTPAPGCVMEISLEVRAGGGP